MYQGKSTFNGGNISIYGSIEFNQELVNSLYWLNKVFNPFCAYDLIGFVEFIGVKMMFYI